MIHFSPYAQLSRMHLNWFSITRSASPFQVERSWNEDQVDERSVEEINSDDLSARLLIVDNKEYAPLANHASQSPITILSSSSEVNQNSVDTNLSRPPPPLKAAHRGQSLLKNSSVTMQIHTSNGSGNGGIVSITSSGTDESKRTQWKCKRCNYRDSNKDNVLSHVKSHYESNEERVSPCDYGRLQLLSCLRVALNARFNISFLFCRRIHLAAETVRSPHRTRPLCPFTECTTGRTWRLYLNAISVHTTLVLRRMCLVTLY